MLRLLNPRLLICAGCGCPFFPGDHDIAECVRRRDYVAARPDPPPPPRQEAAPPQ